MTFSDASSDSERAKQKAEAAGEFVINIGFTGTGFLRPYTRFSVQSVIIITEDLIYSVKNLFSTDFYLYIG